VEAQLVLGAVARLGRASADQQHKQAQDQQHNSVNI
jgi:hypothetical protein